MSHPEVPGHDPRTPHASNVAPPPGAAAGARPDDGVPGAGPARAARGGWSGRTKAVALAGSLCVFVLGWFGNTVLDAALALFQGEMTITELADKQAAGFRDVETQLRALQSSVDANGRVTLAAMAVSIADLKKTNDALVERAREAGRQAAPGGTSAGEGRPADTVGVNASMTIDASTSVGVQSIGRNTVIVNVSSLGERAQRKYLSVGEFAEYRNGRGEVCKTTLMAIVPDAGPAGRDDAATFRTACATAP